MELEKQVVSLELAKKLKELGVKQESLWWWVKQVGVEKFALVPDGSINPGTVEHYSAFTVAELGEMLPRYIISVRTKDGWICGDLLSVKRFKERPFGVVDTGIKIEMDIKVDLSDTEANARATMLIYLLENKLLKGN